ncbi:MAG TPA: methyltransferase domain-containing protein [Acidimicrobiales bacterium]|nr:methyltransferase domain-containing protein [Acidimicrobiales bacterium]
MPQGDEYGQEYTDRQAGRSRLRKVMRRPWLRAAAGFVEGPAIDLGCGVGELLERLPAGSMGLEINRASVAHCRAKGLDVTYYDGWADDWRLSAVCDAVRARGGTLAPATARNASDPDSVDPGSDSGPDLADPDADSGPDLADPGRSRGDGTFDTLIMSHVLEHLDDPVDVLHRLLGTAGPLGLRQVLIVVPGRAGFRSQETHRTFVDRAMLSDAAVTRDTGFVLASTSYFPGNLRRIGDVFLYHELRASYVRL